MATVNLSNIVDPDSDTVQVDFENNPAALALPTTPLRIAGMDGDFSAEDINIPRINVVQKMSKLADEPGWSPGDIAFMNEVKLASVNQPINITVFNVDRWWQQYLPYGSEEEPKIFRTREEVFAAGGSITFQDPNEYRPLAHITALIEAPATLGEDELELFPFERDGKHYALARWTVSGTAYGKTAKVVLSTLAMMKAHSPHVVKFAMEVKKVTKGSNTWFQPQITFGGKHTPEFAEWAAELNPLS